MSNDNFLVGASRRTNDTSHPGTLADRLAASSLDFHPSAITARPIARRSAVRRAARSAAGVIAFVIAGCGPGVVHEPPTPAAPHERQAAAPPFVPPRYAVGRGSYQVTSTATIQFVGDSSARPDTLQTVDVIRYEASWTGTGLDFTGSVQSRVTAASARMQAAIGESLDPVPFRATVETATSSVHMVGDSAEATTCPSPHAGALATARQYLVSVPRTLAPGSAWTDTTVSTTCRGEIPVTTTAIRRFTVALEHPPTGPVAIVVSHLSTLTMHGAVTHRGSQISLTGSGTRQFEDRYDAFTGELKNRAATMDMDLSVGVAGAPSKLHEHVDLKTVPIA